MSSSQESVDLKSGRPKRVVVFSRNNLNAEDVKSMEDECTVNLQSGRESQKAIASVGGYDSMHLPEVSSNQCQREKVKKLPVVSDVMKQRRKKQAKVSKE